MKLSESQFIRDRCLKVIRESSMHEDSWEMTLLDRCHDSIASIIPLGEEEFPLVSFYAGEGDWTLYTTHRLICEVSGKRGEIARPDYGSADFGGDVPQIVKTQLRLIV